MSWYFPLLPPSCPKAYNKHLPQVFMHSAYERCLVSYAMHMMLSRSAHWFPRRGKPRTAFQLLIGNRFPSAFQHTSPESDSGLENWRQKPMAQGRQETEQFLFSKENTPETGWDEEVEGRAFPRLYGGKGGTLGVNRAAFCLLPARSPPPPQFL